MPFSASRIAAALAPRLDPVVPRPFRVHADGQVLVLEHPDGWDSYQSLNWMEDEHWLSEAAAEFGPDLAVARLAERWVVHVLDSLQDDIPEALREPWPALTPTRFAPPQARCDGERVYAWYGESERTPIIALEPIPLHELLVESPAGGAAP